MHIVLSHSCSCPILIMLLYFHTYTQVLMHTVILEEGLILVPPLADLCCSHWKNICSLPTSSWPFSTLSSLPSCSHSLSQSSASDGSIPDLTCKLCGTSSLHPLFLAPILLHAALFLILIYNSSNKPQCPVLVLLQLHVTLTTKLHLC